jgi:DNA primase
VARIGPASFTIENMPERLASQKRDPWHAFETSRAKLTRQMLEALV